MVRLIHGFNFLWIIQVNFFFSITKIVYMIHLLMFIVNNCYEDKNKRKKIFCEKSWILFFNRKYFSSLLNLNEIIRCLIVAFTFDNFIDKLIIVTIIGDIRLYHTDIKPMDQPEHVTKYTKYQIHSSKITFLWTKYLYENLGNMKEYNKFIFVNILQTIFLTENKKKNFVCKSFYIMQNSIKIC